MDSFAAWQLRLRQQVLGTSDDRYDHRDHALKRLVGRCLWSLQVNAVTDSTRLAFSGDLTLTTTTLNTRVRRRPHWLLRLPTSGSDDWRAVVLRGTSQPSRP